MTIDQEYAKPVAGAGLVFDIDAQDVFLVMRPERADMPVRVRVFDGAMRDFGADNHDGVVTVTEDRLYQSDSPLFRGGIFAV